MFSDIEAGGTHCGSVADQIEFLARRLEGFWLKESRGEARTKLELKIEVLKLCFCKLRLEGSVFRDGRSRRGLQDLELKGFACFRA